MYLPIALEFVENILAAIPSAALALPLLPKHGYGNVMPQHSVVVRCSCGTTRSILTQLKLMYDDVKGLP